MFIGKYIERIFDLAWNSDPQALQKAQAGLDELSKAVSMFNSYVISSPPEKNLTVRATPFFVGVQLKIVKGRKNYTCDYCAEVKIKRGERHIVASLQGNPKLPDRFCFACTARFLHLVIVTFPPSGVGYKLYNTCPFFCSRCGEEIVVSTKFCPDCERHFI